jgi:hypothetical protein
MLESNMGSSRRWGNRHLPTPPGFWKKIKIEEKDIHQATTTTKHLKIAENKLKWLKCKFLSKFSGFPTLEKVLAALAVSTDKLLLTFQGQKQTSMCIVIFRGISLTTLQIMSK